MSVDIRDQLPDHGSLAEVLAVEGIAVVGLAAPARVNQNHRRQRPVCDTLRQKMRRILIGTFGVVASVQPVDYRVPPRGVLIAGRKPDVIADLLVHRGAVITMVCDARLRILRLVEPDHVVWEARFVWIDSLRFEEWKRAKPEQNRISHGFEFRTSANNKIDEVEVGVGWGVC